MYDTLRHYFIFQKQPVPGYSNVYNNKCLWYG